MVPDNPILTRVLNNLVINVPIPVKPEPLQTKVVAETVPTTLNLLVGFQVPTPKLP